MWVFYQSVLLKSTIETLYRPLAYPNENLLILLPTHTHTEALKMVYVLLSYES